MDTNMDFKVLWQQQPVPPANTEALKKTIRRFQSVRTRRIILVNLMLTGIIFFLAWIWFYFQPQMLSTKLGIVMSVLAMLLFLVSSTKVIPLYKSDPESQAGADYLQHLMEVRKKEYFLQTRIMNLYFLLLGAGVCVYLYEYALKMTAIAGIITYSATITWFVFNWFYIRPVQIRKQQKELDIILEQLQNIKSQFVTDQI